MTPVETAHHQWAIVSSGEVIAILRSNAAAWAWIDRHDPEHAAMIERHYRIRMAFSPADD